MVGPGGNFEDVGLRATIQNMEAFARDATRANAFYARIGEAAVKAATQTKASMGHAGTAVRNMSEQAVIGFNNTSKGMAQMAGHAMHSQGPLMKLLEPLSKLGFAVFGIQMIVSALGLLGNAILGASIQWEQFQVSFKTFLGSADLGAKKLEELAEFARKTPFTLPEVVQGSKQMLAYGFSAASIIPILRKVGDAAAGLGRESLPVIIRALGQMQAATKVNSRDMLQLTEAGIPAWKFLADAMQISVGQVQKLVEKGVVPADKAITVLLAGMEKKFGGLMEEQSRTFGGMLSNLQDWVFRAQVIFTKPVFDILRGQLDKLLTALDTPDVERALERWGQAAGTALQLIVKGISTAGQVIVPVFQGIGRGIDFSINTLLPRVQVLTQALGLDLGTALQISIPLIALWSAGITVRAIGALAAWSASMVVATARTAAWLAMLGLGPIMSFTVAIAGATAALTLYAIRGTGAALKATGEMVIVLVRQGIPAFVGLAATILTRTIPAMVAFVAVGMVNVVRNMPKLLASLAGAALAFGNVSVQATVAATRIAAAWAVSMAPVVIGAIGAVLAALAPFAVAIGAIAAIAAAVVVAWANNWGDIQGITGRVLSWVADRITDFINWLETVPVIGGAVGQVKQWIGASVNAFKEWAPKLTTAAGDAVGGLVDQFRKGFPAIQDALKGMLGIPEVEQPDLSKLQIGATQAAQAMEGLDRSLMDLGETARDTFSEEKWAIRRQEQAVKALQENVKALESQLRDAEEAMRTFSEPRLPGMQAAENEVFSLELALKKARLEELKLGDAGKKAAKDVSSTFDILAAQQEEIANGLPVTYQLVQRLAEDAKRRAQKAEKETPETEVERLTKVLDIKRLEKEINFEPMLRSLKEIMDDLTGANKEISFDQAVQGLISSAERAANIRVELGNARLILEQQEAVLEAQKVLLDAQQEAADKLNDTKADQVALENLSLAALQSQTGEMEKQNALQRERAEALASASRVAVNPQQFSVGTGFAGGGTASRGGLARVGERGTETVLLPAGAQVVPASPMPATSVSSSETNTFNIEGARDSIDVVDAIRRYQAYRRIMQGRP